MKNLIKCVIAVAVLLSASIGQAQQMQKKTPQERAQNQLQWMQKNLAITDEQGKKAYDIILHYAQEADKAINEPAGGGKRQEMQDMKKNKDDAIKGILTGDQYQKYEAHVQEMQEKMRTSRAANGQWGG